MLTDRDVGHRVVVRRRLDNGMFSDILGELASLGDKDLVVRTAAGEQVTVPLASVAAAKQIPPRAVRAADLRALEAVAAAAWPARDTARLGDWLLRAAGGFTGRANSVLGLGDPGVPLPAALEQVTGWYAARGLTAQFDLPQPVSRVLDTALAARGWELACTVLVQTARLADVLAAIPDRADLPPVRLDSVPDEDWLAVAGARKGTLPPVARDLLTAPPGARFATIRDNGRPGDGGQPGDEGRGDGDGRLVAIGRGVVDGDWLGVFLVETLPAVRRRGVARHLIRALAADAAAHGATRAYLQVESTNDAAIALYAALGFTTHHTYNRRRAPG